MWKALEIIIDILIIVATIGGAVFVVGMVGSFINRIGNPYDKW